MPTNGQQKKQGCFIGQKSDGRNKGETPEGPACRQAMTGEGEPVMPPEADHEGKGEGDGIPDQRRDA